jgi:hypothetical protein
MSDLFDSPDPPNPFLTAAAQTGSNVSTGVANAFLNNVNQVTPEGSLSYNVTDTYNWTDPSTGFSYSLPRFTATQSLTPAGQQSFNQIEQAKLNLTGLAQQQSGFLKNQFANPLSLAGAPAFGDVSKLTNAPKAQTGFGPSGAVQFDPFAAGGPGTIGTTFGAAPNVQSTFGQAGPITKGYEDFASERNRVEAGLMERLNPSLGIERQKYEQQLADQGIRYGSTAYQDAMRNYSMQANDARLAAIGQAGNEQQRMSQMAGALAAFQNQAQQQEFGQALGRGEFANKAQQQIYQQAQGRGQFANEAQKQLYEQLLGRGQFANAAQQQAFGQEAMRGQFYNTAQAQNFQQGVAGFNATNAQRNQYLNEIFSLRNQPINEISALLSGGQVSQPNFVNTPQSQIANTDVAGIMNRNFDQQMAISNQQAQLANTMIGGSLGALGGYLRSDRDTKQNIEKMGSVFAENPDGGDEKLPIYSYAYKDDPTQQRRVGPMAQDVEKINKRAVRKFGDTKYIDVPKLGSILKAA